MHFLPPSSVFRWHHAVGIFLLLKFANISWKSLYRSFDSISSTSSDELSLSLQMQWSVWFFYSFRYLLSIHLSFILFTFKSSWIRFFSYLHRNRTYFSWRFSLSYGLGNISRTIWELQWYTSFWETCFFQFFL